MKGAALFRGSFSGYERDRMWMWTGAGAGGPPYVDASYVLGLDLDSDGRASAAIDVDGDGDLDLALLSLQGLQLLSNEIAKRQHFVRVKLKATRSEPLALGAIVTVHTGTTAQVARVAITAGFQTQVLPELHFGLGGATRVEAIEVKWPSGAAERFEGALSGSRVILVEGEGKTSAASLPSWPPESAPRDQTRFSLKTTVKALSGEQRPIDAGGKPAVINFWGPSCKPCEKELPALSRVFAKHRASASFLGISVEVEDPAAVGAYAKAKAIEYPIALGTDEAVHTFFGTGGEVTLPSTFVFDAGGRLRRTFYRPIEEAELAGVLDALEVPQTAEDWLGLGIAATRERRFEDARRALAKAVELDPSDATARWRLGVVELNAGDAAAAVKTLEKATSLEPSDAEAWTDLGYARLKAGDEAGAERALAKAVEIAPQNARAQNELGRAKLRKKDHDGAIAAFESAVRADPDLVQPWKNLAGAQEEAGRLEDANRTRAAMRQRFGGR